MSKQRGVSPLGALVGGLVGVVGRPAVIYGCYFAGSPMDGEMLSQILLTSCVIGFVVGAVAGLIGRIILGAVVGALLAALFFAVTYIPLLFLFCIGTWERGKPAQHADTEHFTVIAGILVTLVGVLSGVIGGLIERWRERPPGPRRSQVIDD